MILYIVKAMNDTFDQAGAEHEENPINSSEPIINIANQEAETNSAGGAADEFLNLEQLIKNYVSQIENLKQELKKQKELFNNSFESDAVYKEHEEKTKEAAKLKSETKQQILKQPTLASLSEKIEEIKDELKELQETLSDYLLQYQKMTGFNEIETESGESLIIVSTAKLVKGSSRP